MIAREDAFAAAQDMISSAPPEEETERMGAEASRSLGAAAYARWSSCQMAERTEDRSSAAAARERIASPGLRRQLTCRLSRSSSSTVVGGDGLFGQLFGGDGEDAEGAAVMAAVGALDGGAVDSLVDYHGELEVNAATDPEWPPCPCPMPPYLHLQSHAVATPPPLHYTQHSCTRAL